MVAAVNTFAYTGEEPWHRLGTKLTPDADMDTWLAESGLNYELETRPVYVPQGSSAALGLPEDNFRAVYSPAYGVLSIVSPYYHPVQPRAVLEFFRELCEGILGYKMETAGVLRDGKAYFALARVPLSFQVTKEDYNTFLLVSSSADGSSATIARTVMTRVVCANTLAMAFGEKDRTSYVSLSHRCDIDAIRWQDVKDQLGVGSFEERAIAYTKWAEELEERRVNAESFFRHITGIDEDMEKLTRKSPLVKLLRANENAPGATPGTLYGALNATTFFTDHMVRSRHAGNAVWSSQFGNGAALKSKAVNYCQELLAA